MPSKMRGKERVPKGLLYYPDFLTEEEEKAILSFIRELDYSQVVLHGQAAKRTVVHYGYTYDYEAVKIKKGEPFPDIIQKLSDQCAHQAGIAKDDIVQCLISHYPKSATIGWHRDKFLFGPTIMGVSLLSSCKMRFQHTHEEIRYVHEQKLLPKSMYILSGPARTVWEHSIPAVDEERYSITFRTLSSSIKN